MKKRFIYPWILVTIVIVGISFMVFYKNEMRIKQQEQEYHDNAEKEFYEKCVTVADYRAYIRKYPNGLYLELCMNRINEFVLDSITREENQRKIQQSMAEATAKEKAKKEEQKRIKEAEKSKLEKEKQHRLEYPQIGDLKVFDDGTKGIVYYVDNSGKHGLVVSLDEFKGKFGNKYIGYIVELWDRGDETFMMGRGATNTTIIIKALGGCADAANWCRLKGADWYLPCYAEMKQLLAYANLSKGSMGQISREIVRNGGESLSNTDGYWVSSADNYYEDNYYYCNPCYCSYNGLKNYDKNKGSVYLVRAVRMF